MSNSSFSSTHLVLTASISAALAAIAAYLYQNGLKDYLSTNSKEKQTQSKEEKLLRHVFNRAADNNPTTVLSVMESFCKETGMTNICADKANIIKNEIINRKPQTVIELGGYCGYSAVLIGNCLPEDGHLYSIESDALHAAIATKIVEFAGLQDKVSILVGTADSRISSLRKKYKINAIDVIFINNYLHSQYLSEFKLFEQEGLITSGSVIIADNTKDSVAQSYLNNIRTDVHYTSNFHPVNLKFKSENPDGLEISVKLDSTKAIKTSIKNDDSSILRELSGSNIEKLTNKN